MESLKKHINLTMLFTFVGLLAAISSHLLLSSLSWVSDLRDSNLIIIWSLPIAGLIIAWIYEKFSQGLNYNFELLKKDSIPARVPLILWMSNILTQISGGSAGREGTAVLISAGLSDQIKKRIHIDVDRDLILKAAVGAGFGSALGTPIAGLFFGLEIFNSKKFELNKYFYCFLASIVSYFIGVLIKTPHSHYPNATAIDLNLISILYFTISILCFAMTGKIFIELHSFLKKNLKRVLINPYLLTVVGGTLIVILFYAEGSMRYVGLGLPVINESFEKITSLMDPLYKILFTILTLNSGFKGGEFTPLVFIGATLGSALSQWISLPLTTLTSLGFTCVFAAASKAPLACAFMAAELFGWSLFPWALIGCFICSFITGKKGIYSET